jgi:hypothetical protein
MFTRSAFQTRLDAARQLGLAAVVISLALGHLVAEDRSYDGSGNNLANPMWGAAGTPLLRKASPAYADGILSPAGATRLGARDISNAVAAQLQLVPNSRQMSDWVFQWGQFIDHDLDLTIGASPEEPFPIPIPAGDPIFDPTNTGTQIMPFNRSKYDPSSGTGVGNPRQQINEITSYIDGSMVYGSDESRATALRSMNGGRLLTSAGDLLPFNTMGLPNGTGGHPDPTLFFVAGDVRANEQVGLTAVHTLLLREHNRVADELAQENPGWTDEQIYQRARKIVGAEIQVITYQEFLPALLGPYAPGVHGSYDPQIDGSVANEFSTAFFRVGHTMLSHQLMRMQNDGTPAPGGHIPLRDAFFQPVNIPTPADLDYLLKGLAMQQQQEVDNMIVDDVRNFLFGEPAAGGFDLAALNIQRGRDHGLPDYNSLRMAYGLTPVNTFEEISSDPTVQLLLESVYASVNDIDPWVGALAEDHLPGTGAGALIVAALVDQFTRSRDGDRFWYRNDPDFSAKTIAALEDMTLSRIIRLNSGITHLQANVFFVPEPGAVVLAALASCGLACLTRRQRRS